MIFLFTKTLTKCAKTAKYKKKNFFTTDISRQAKNIFCVMIKSAKIYKNNAKRIDENDR